MNQFTYEQREELFETASDIQKNLYEGHTTGLALGKISKKHSLQAKHVDFIIAVGDVILGLVPQEKLPELLMERLGIERAQAMRITADVLDFLAPLDQPEVAETATAVPINTSPETVNDNSLASEIAEAEAAIQTMQPIRTMSHDMETMRSALGDEVVHTAASQADLLDRTTTPKADAPDDRWNTAQT